jgi:hypothetical protein
MDIHNGCIATPERHTLTPRPCMTITVFEFLKNRALAQNILLIVAIANSSMPHDADGAGAEGLKGSRRRRRLVLLLAGPLRCIVFRCEHGNVPLRVLRHDGPHIHRTNRRARLCIRCSYLHARIHTHTHIHTLYPHARTHTHTHAHTVFACSESL